MNTVSTLAMSYRSRAMVSSTQAELSRLAGEIGTGFKRDVAASAGTRLGEAISARNVMDRIEQYDSSMTLVGMRLSTMETSLREVEDVASGFFAKLSAMQGDAQTAGAMREEALSALARIVQAFNVSSGDRFLFSGVDVTSPPLQDPTVVNPRTGLSPLQAMQQMVAANPPADAASAAALADLIGTAFADGTAPAGSGFEETFYNGTPSLAADGTPSRRVSGVIGDGRTIEYGIQANDPAFRDILRGIYMIAAADFSSMPEEAYEAYVGAAFDAVGNGLSASRAVMANLGGQQNEVEALRKANEKATALLNERIIEIEASDLVEANARMNVLETQLQASIAITNRLSSLSVAAMLSR